MRIGKPAWLVGLMAFLGVPEVPAFTTSERSGYFHGRARRKTGRPRRAYSAKLKAKRKARRRRLRA
jgi:hypothetical protein